MILSRKKRDWEKTKLCICDLQVNHKKKYYVQFQKQQNYSNTNLSMLLLMQFIFLLCICCRIIVPTKYASVAFDECSICYFWKLKTHSKTF